MDDLIVENMRLGATFEALKREHADLQSRSVDLAEHEAHRAKLRAHLADLHVHLERWRNRSRD
jgi:hypothetical protein